MKKLLIILALMTSTITMYPNMRELIYVTDDNKDTLIKRFQGQVNDFKTSLTSQRGQQQRNQTRELDLLEALLTKQNALYFAQNSKIGDELILDAPYKTGTPLKLRRVKSLPRD